MGYQVEKKTDDDFCCLVTIHEYNRRTDRQTDRLRATASTDTDNNNNERLPALALKHSELRSGTYQSRNFPASL